MTRNSAEVPPRNDAGEVLLFPCRISHSRMFPRKHSFAYRYLMVGVLVGFEGNAGGMVSVEAGDKHKCALWFSLARQGGWFSIHAGDYLERGKSELGLRGKLDEYLCSQGVDPVAYPYAYLVTAPRFLGYQFNPVSFWYLYDADKRLSAMILEVNNTFDERRMYFLAPEDSSSPQTDCPSASQPDEAATPSAPGHHSPRQTVFNQSWPKDFHVSPFNSRKGSYTVTATDPLFPPTQGTNQPHISITITLTSSKSHPKLTATLTSASAAIDPSTLTNPQKLHFLTTWAWLGLLTVPRILAQAAVLFVRHRLRVWARPEPLKGTIGRRPTRTERRVEPVFRGYLSQLVEQSPTRLGVTYSPAAGICVSGGIDAGPVIFRSPATQRKQSSRSQSRDESGPDPGSGLAPGSEAGRSTDTDTPAVQVETLEIQVLTPEFYTRFARCANPGETLLAESAEGGTVCVSAPEVLAKLVTAVAVGRSAPVQGGIAERTCSCSGLIRFLRIGARGRLGRAVLALVSSPLLGIGVADRKEKNVDGSELMGVGRRDGTSGNG